MAALRKDMLGMSLLKISAPDFTTWILGGYCQDRHAAAMTVVEAIDQMRVPGAATPVTHRYLARNMRLGPGRKRAHLLVSHMNPADLLPNPNQNVIPATEITTY